MSKSERRRQRLEQERRRNDIIQTVIVLVVIVIGIVYTIANRPDAGAQARAAAWSNEIVEMESISAYESAKAYDIELFKEEAKSGR